MNHRNFSIDFFRFIFMLAICSLHFYFIPFFTHGYLAVEFFFILSGFFIYQTYSSKRISILNYFVNRSKKLIPKFLIVLSAFLLFKTVVFLFTSGNFEELLCSGIKSIDDIFLLSGVGIFPDKSILGPAWYISVLLWGGMWLYALLIYNIRFSMIVFFPLTLLFWLTYVRYNGGHMELWHTDFCFYMPFIRGISDMIVGIFVGYIWNSKRNSIETKYSLFFNVASTLSLFLIVTLFFVHEDLDIYSIVLIPFLIIGCMNKNGWFQKCLSYSVFGYLGKISYDMYIVHWPIILFIKLFLLKNAFFQSVSIYIIYALYLGVVILVSSSLDYVYSKKIQKYIK